MQVTIEQVLTILGEERVARRVAEQEVERLTAEVERLRARMDAKGAAES